MIRPSGWDGVAFSEAVDGDQRGDPVARDRLSTSLGISSQWATVGQVHGAVVHHVTRSGEAGVGDALWTDRRGLPLAVFTADCFGVVLRAAAAVGVAHAGWRGVADGVVRALRSEMTSAGHHPLSAAIGPGIGPCCFEVGPEVIALFEADAAVTTWGTPSVDLAGALAADLDGLQWWAAGACTMHDGGMFSHRVDGTKHRMATIGWLS